MQELEYHVTAVHDVGKGRFGVLFTVLVVLLKEGCCHLGKVHKVHMNVIRTEMLMLSGGVG